MIKGTKDILWYDEDCITKADEKAKAILAWFGIFLIVALSYAGGATFFFHQKIAYNLPSICTHSLSIPILSIMYF